MNLTLTSATSGNANANLAAPAVGADAVVPASPGAPAQPTDAISLMAGMAAPAQQAAAPALPQFGLWFDQAMLVAGHGAELPAGSATEDGEGAPLEAQMDAQSGAPAIESTPLLGAMSMPIMSLASAAQATLAAVAAALPGAPAIDQPGRDSADAAPAAAANTSIGSDPAADFSAISSVSADTRAPAALPAGPAAALLAQPMMAPTVVAGSLPTEQHNLQAGAQASAQLAAQATLPAPGQRPAATARGAVPLDLNAATTEARVAAMVLPLAQPAADTGAQRDSGAASSSTHFAGGLAANPAARLDSQASSAGFAATMTQVAGEQAAPALERTGGGIVLNSGVPVADSASDSVTLSGPPTAWRQSLQEALGERLQLQVGRNAEQAVIRLEPPMLGQVEIAIRHSVGALEVHISASNRDVLRQLQAVSENLRADLAQRQFTEVAVSVSATRAGQGTGGMGGGDQPGRGRQEGQPDGQADEWTPGLALAEAHHAATFSLQGRK